MDDAQQFMKFLANTGKIEQNKTLESFFQRPYKQLEEIFEGYISNMSNVFHDNKLHTLIIITWMAGIFKDELMASFEDYKISANASKVSKSMFKKPFT